MRQQTIDVQLHVSDEPPTAWHLTYAERMQKSLAEAFPDARVTVTHKPYVDGVLRIVCYGMKDKYTARDQVEEAINEFHRSGQFKSDVPVSQK